MQFHGDVFAIRCVDGDETLDAATLQIDFVEKFVLVEIEVPTGTLKLRQKLIVKVEPVDPGGTSDGRQQD